MVHPPCQLTIRRQIGLVILAVLAGIVSPPSLRAQGPVHYRHSGNMPPGAIGREQVSRGGPMRGYYQPVQIQGPAGSMIAVAVDGKFTHPQPSPVTVGLQVGRVYRVQVTRIPANEGLEVYPTIEVINRLYPPQGQKRRFPVPIELTREELEYALNGKLVTRVIYLENPTTALPFPEDDKKHQRFFEVAADQDPLKRADRLGRPMAILRMGSRLPEEDGPSKAFLYGSPPLIQYGGQPNR